MDDLRLGLVWVAGSPTAAAALLEPDTATRQYDESLCLLLARAHDAAGRPTDAFGTIRSLQRPLRDDLGVDAAEEVRELEARMHDRAVALPRRAVRSAAGPWPGLLPHERDDARRFFGREKELEVAAGDRPWARSN